MAKKKAMANTPAALEDKPAANEAEDALQKLLRRFDDQGVSIDEVQWRQMTDLDQRVARVWIGAREQHGTAVIPIALEQYASEELVAELNKVVEKAAKSRVLLMPCIFKNPGYEKLEEGDKMIVFPLRLPDTHLGEVSAIQFFRKKLCKVEICRRPLGEWGQQEFLEDGDRRTVIFESGITTYKWSDDHYLITVRCNESVFATGGTHSSGLDEAIDWGGKGGSVRLTVLGDIKGGKDTPATPKAGPGRPKKNPAAEAPKKKEPPKLPGTDVDEKFQISMTDKFMVEIRIFAAPENKFGCEWTGNGPAGGCKEAEPSVRSSTKDVMIASISHAVDYWQEYSDEESELILKDLRHWLRELEANKPPKLIEAELFEYEEEVA
jgi:hypothetical protein